MLNELTFQMGKKEILVEIFQALGQNISKSLLSNNLNLTRIFNQYELI